MNSKLIIRILVPLGTLLLSFSSYSQMLEIEGDAIIKGKISQVTDPTDPQDVVTKGHMNAYIDQILLNFGISLGSVGVQGLLNLGYHPLEILNGGASTNDFIGLNYAGGIIFHLTSDGKGMVAASTDLNSLKEWGCVGTDLPDVPNVAVSPPSGLGAEIGDGVTNTAAILSSGNCPMAPAALACKEYLVGDFSDWFLPSIKELNEMFMKIGNGASAPNTNIGGFSNSRYWSSTELHENRAWLQFFGDGSLTSEFKFDGYRVRAVRTF